MSNVATQRITVRLRRDEIAQAIVLIKGIARFTHTFSSADVFKDYGRAYRRTRATSMVATGELRSKLFYRRWQNVIGTMFSLGYRATSNNQSVVQEFSSGRVHKSHSEHFQATGRIAYPKCSRSPEDLYSMFGGYTSNPDARRRALGRSIDEVFITKTSGRAIENGGNYFYVPDFRFYTWTLSKKLSFLYKSVGIT